jgi:hypothetical protein
MSVFWQYMSALASKMSGFATLVSGIWHFSRNPQKPAEEYKKYSTLINYDFYD